MHEQPTAFFHLIYQSFHPRYILICRSFWNTTIGHHIHKMKLPNFILLFLLISSTIVANRIRRFLNSEIHNRIDVLEKSHEAHIQTTTHLRDIVFGITITISVVFILIVCGIIYLCHRVHKHTRSVNSSLPNSPQPTSTDVLALYNLFTHMTHSMTHSFAHRSSPGFITPQHTPIPIPPPLKY